MERLELRGGHLGWVVLSLLLLAILLAIVTSVWDSIGADQAVEVHSEGRVGESEPESVSDASGEGRSASGRVMHDAHADGPKLRVMSRVGGSAIADAKAIIWPADRAPYRASSDTNGEVLLLGKPPWYLELSHPDFVHKRVAIGRMSPRTVVLDVGAKLTVSVSQQSRAARRKIRIALIPVLKGQLEDSVFFDRDGWQHRLHSLEGLLSERREIVRKCLRTGHHSIELREQWFHLRGMDYNRAPSNSEVFNVSPLAWTVSAKAGETVEWSSLSPRCRYRLAVISDVYAEIRSAMSPVKDGNGGMSNDVRDDLHALVKRDVPGLSRRINVEKFPHWIIDVGGELPSADLDFRGLRHRKFVAVVDSFHIKRPPTGSSSSARRESQLYVDSPDIVRLAFRSPGEKRVSILVKDESHRYWIIRRSFVVTLGQVVRLTVTCDMEEPISVLVRRASTPRAQAMVMNVRSDNLVLCHFSHFGGTIENVVGGTDRTSFSRLLLLPVDRRASFFGLSDGQLMIQFANMNTYLSSDFLVHPVPFKVFLDNQISPSGEGFESSGYAGPIDSSNFAEVVIAPISGSSHEVTISGVEASLASRVCAFIESKNGYRRLNVKSKVLPGKLVRVSFRGLWPASKKVLIGFWRNDIVNDSGLPKPEGKYGFAVAGAAASNGSVVKFQEGTSVVFSRNSSQRIPRVVLASPDYEVRPAVRAAGAPIFVRVDSLGRAVVSGIPKGVKFRYWHIVSAGQSDVKTFTVPLNWSKLEYSVELHGEKSK